MVTVWSEEKAAEVREFIEGRIGERFPDQANTPAAFHAVLKNGVILCKLANSIRPGIIPSINSKKMPFLEMENVGNYIKACTTLGLPSAYNFMTVDLYEGKNLAQVVLNVIALRRELGLGFEKAGKGVAPPKMVDVRGDDQSVSSPSVHSTVPTVISASGSGSSGGLKAGVLAPQQGLECRECLRPITAAVINACGNYYHNQCFSCKKCGAKIGTGKYVELDKKPYCEKCSFALKSAPGVGAKTKDMGFKFAKK